MHNIHVMGNSKGSKVKILIFNILVFSSIPHVHVSEDKHPSGDKLCEDYEQILLLPTQPVISTHPPTIT